MFLNTLVRKKTCRKIYVVQSRVAGESTDKSERVQTNPKFGSRVTTEGQYIYSSSFKVSALKSLTWDLAKSYTYPECIPGSYYL